MTDNFARVSDFRVGSVLSRGIAILLKNLVPFMLLALLVFSPVILYTALAYFFPIPLYITDPVFGGLDVIVIASVPLGMLLNAGIVYGTFQELRGRRASTGKCLLHGARTILPVIGVTVCVLICIAAGLALFIIPGIIVAVMFWVAIPVAVVEKSGIVESLKRSANLTSGYRWPVFGIMFLLVIVDRVTNAIIANLYFGSVAFYYLILFAIIFLFAALDAVVTAVGYHDLRVAKEGVDTDRIAAVFD